MVSRGTRDDAEARFAQLFDEYSAPIFNYVLRMVADRDRAADITQDTFIKAYRKLHTVTDATSTRSWLYRIATNTAIDDMRRTAHGDARWATMRRPSPTGPILAPAPRPRPWPPPSMSVCSAPSAPSAPTIGSASC